MPSVKAWRRRSLPTPIQFMCQGGDEALSLSLAAAYEAARGPMPNPPLWDGGDPAASRA